MGRDRSIPWQVLSGYRSPVVFCNFIAPFLPIYAFYRRKALFDIIYYLMAAAATQAVITPGLKYNFPHYEFFKFWTVHGGLLIVIIYVIVVFREMPRFKGIFSTFLFLQVYVLVNIGVNFLLEANYLFLREKPQFFSVLRALGEWPYYILIMDMLIIPYFMLLYIPIYLYQRTLSTHDINTSR